MKWKDYYVPGLENHSEALKQVYGRSFIQQLRIEQGKIITITTGREVLTGRVIRLAMDYIEFQYNERTYYIPYHSILYYYSA
ncbi:DUF2642 domain-containing protein [Ammoniphilus sp. YIM 78166]|uniref:DUF2642 domain-containing protein n=1 Tax=Ammoniphilus sp. YIM 78166 TaxID=1644106 RepID=UPI0014314E9B|nr:DUF2642 domain-containing protein [Ammoniphilus sp. YIM 78166]